MTATIHPRPALVAAGGAGRHSRVPARAGRVDPARAGSRQLVIRSNSSQAPIAVRLAISAAAPAFSAVT